MSEQPKLGQAHVVDCRASTRAQRYVWRDLTGQERAQRLADIAEHKRQDEDRKARAQARREAIERLRASEVGRDLLVVLGIETGGT